MPSCNGASGYTSATFTAPPSTAAHTNSTCAAVRSTNGSISGVITSAPSGTPFGGTSTTTPAPATANAAGVGASNRTRTDMPTPRSRRRCASDTASSECPPSSKKLSSTPTRSTPSTSANTWHTISSTTVTGPRPPPTTTNSGTGNAARSTFPFTVRGSSSRTTTADGTMYSGNRPAANARTPTGSSPALLSSTGTTYATSRLSPGTSSRTMTTAWATSGWAARTASTSPGSTRNPRTFT